MGNCLGFSDEAPQSRETIRPSSTGTSKNNGGNSANEMNILRQMDVDFPNGKILSTRRLKKFTLSDLSRATRNFQPDSIIGRGLFGKVFKGWLNEETLAPATPGSGMVTAVERRSAETMQGINESAIRFLGRLSHPNLVKLLGYCLDKKELLLVYEFMAEGSLEKHLFKEMSHPLPWRTRLEILIGAARGLAFLHTFDKQVICRDFKASNILLDSDYHAKLSDFGLAKKVPTRRPFPIRGSVRMVKFAGSFLSVAGRAMGTCRYADPAMAAGHLYDDKSDDVYGFGGVLLEMLSGRRAPDNPRLSGERNLKKLVDLTGLRALDTGRPSGQQKLVEGAMDKRLKGEYPPEAALKAAQLSLKCLDDDPRRRPSMKEVVDALEQIEANHQRPRAAKPKTVAHPVNHLPSPMV